jgi:hypothetical protein
MQFGIRGFHGDVFESSIILEYNSASLDIYGFRRFEGT